jgi:hypothetical protein
LTPDLEAELRQTYRATVILAAAMLVSVFVYAGVVDLLPRLAPSSEPSADPGTVELLRQVFRGLALVSFLALAWLGARVRRPASEPRARLARLKALTTVGLALAESDRALWARSLLLEPRSHRLLLSAPRLPPLLHRRLPTP